MTVDSRATALYYLLQCVVAITACRHVQKNQHLNIAGFSVLACILAFIVICANRAGWSVTSTGINHAFSIDKLRRSNFIGSSERSVYYDSPKVGEHEDSRMC